MRAQAKKILSRLGRAGMKFELGRIRTVLSHLGDPQNNFPAIHLAGTNGKGSVAAMLEAVLKDQGYRTGLITSPHLMSPVERFRLSGRPISENGLESLIVELDRRLRDIRVPLTQFEFLTTAAFLWLSRQRVDVALVETGLGGRLDATNVMGDVRLTIITNIDLEHTSWLGKTIPQITFEKAGILKPGVPVVTAARGKARDLIRKKASAGRCDVYPADRRESRTFSTNLGGEYQKENLATAVGSLRVLSRQWPIDWVRARRSLRRVDWPGRFETFRQGRRVIVLDGAHNPSAVIGLIRSLHAVGIKKTHVLFGVLKDKDIRSMAEALTRQAVSVHVVPLPSFRSASPRQVASLPEWEGRARAYPTIEDGWRAVRSRSDRIPVLVTGSLYLIGAVRFKMGKNKPVRLLNRSNLP